MTRSLYHLIVWWVHIHRDDYTTHPDLMRADLAHFCSTYHVTPEQIAEVVLALAGDQVRMTEALPRRRVGVTSIDD